ncbi:zinc carboxypeptidase A 1 precursor [Cordyceps fumosorosea ARSEF 2679]|uniref:Zinc carboxypeptidase A 1 n=1 Tax=Cordyceps fumosorosea (strain ARSEF 2679) TaxID=1081104 RepID=A0A168EE40_CORFA|nr:zinc carboxypeptidase A 1 precursor [Cordyceps fumosorosea ARSEF 2679]OAA73705.1 zinc carboxypeptidase A 1 precursor [Cordyceps fumosorosea ARSEF 2679]
MKVSSVLPVAAVLCAATNACLLPEEMDAERHLALHGRYPDDSPQGLRARQGPANPAATGVPIATGDRFAGGTVAPRGQATEPRAIPSIMTPEEVTSGLRALAAKYTDVRFFDAPHKTVESRTVSGIVIGSGSSGPRIYIESGIHARERGGPDHMIYFLSDLLYARDAGTGVTWGGKSYTNAQVRTALSAGIVSIPMINPDGVAFDQRTGRCWRKNRNTASARAGAGAPNAADIGIDLNRNFDGTWDYRKAFHRNVANGRSPPASDNPGSEVFHGTAPFSEQETRNIEWVTGQHSSSLSWFLDLHSFTGVVLHSWGDDEAQTTDPTQHFRNATWDGRRGLKGDFPYKEYIEVDDLDAQKETSVAMVGAMNAAGDGATVTYYEQPSVDLYPTAGTSTDWFLGRYYGRNCGANRINGITIEFGRSSGVAACAFYPTTAQFHNSMRQVAAGLMEIVLAAAGPKGDPKIRKSKRQAMRAVQ